MFPLDGIQEPEGPRWDWPVTLRTGEQVPFDVLVPTWAKICRLTNVARAAAIALALGRSRVPPVAMPLFRTLGFLNDHDHLRREVACVVLASVDLAGMGAARLLTNGKPLPPVFWHLPAPGLTPDEGAVL